jgi:ATP-dependent Zn protease
VSLTRSEYIELIEVALAGRAAEEIRYGTDGVTTGASSDLERATSMVIDMITSAGLGPDGSLLWTTTPSASHLMAAEAELKRIYALVSGKLVAHRGALDDVASRLMAVQELSGPEVVQIVAQSMR